MRKLGPDPYNDGNVFYQPHLWPVNNITMNYCDACKRILVENSSVTTDLTDAVDADAPAADSYVLKCELFLPAQHSIGVMSNGNGIILAVMLVYLIV